MDIDELIAQTKVEAGSVDPLDLLATAANQQHELGLLSDSLLDHWVQHARTAGFSWAQIGTALGVSKQAAQQRHAGMGGTLFGRIRSAVSTVTPGLFTRFSREARDVVVRAQEEARLLGHPKVGTEHLLLAVLAVPNTAAVAALEQRGLDADGARSDVEALVGRGEGRTGGHIPFTPRAKKVLELSLREAHRLHADHIGAEHLLLGIIRDAQGLAMKVLSQRDIDLADLALALAVAPTD